jgi:hypothetical protein
MTTTITTVPCPFVHRGTSAFPCMRSGSCMQLTFISKHIIKHVITQQCQFIVVLPCAIPHSSATNDWEFCSSQSKFRSYTSA